MSQNIYFLYPLFFSISKMAEKRVHKKIDVLENKLTYVYFNGLSHNISLQKVKFYPKQNFLSDIFSIFP